MEALRSIRDRLGRNIDQQSLVRTEQKSNFASYCGKKRCRPVSWTVKAFCLSSRFARKVPANISEREPLVAAGLGEKKKVIPDIECTWDEFKKILISVFPKLRDCGGFDLLRCVPNTKDLEVISLAIAHSPKLLKSVVGNGRIFIRPIQQDLKMDEDLMATAEVSYI